MSRAPTVPVGGALLEQAVRQHCRMLKMPTVATQFERLAEVAVRDGHSHVQYLEALLAAELEERTHKAVARRIQCQRRSDFPHFGRSKFPQVGWAVISR